MQGGEDGCSCWQSALAEAWLSLVADTMNFLAVLVGGLGPQALVVINSSSRLVPPGLMRCFADVHQLLLCLLLYTVASHM